MAIFQHFLNSAVRCQMGSIHQPSFALDESAHLHIDQIRFQ